MTPEDVAELENILKESGKKMWDSAVEACAKIADDENRPSTAERIRRLAFSATPLASPDPKTGGTP